MKIFRWLLLIFLVIALGVAGALFWVQKPSGALLLSHLLTSRLQKSAPGTRLELEKVKLKWPPTLTVEQAVWLDSSGAALVTLKSIYASLGKPRFPPGLTTWKVRTQLHHVDLAKLDPILGHGEWKSDGLLNGDIRFFGRGGRLQDVELDLQSEEPGGNLNSEILQKLVEMMPPDDTRAILLKALGAKETFHFAVGSVELRTEGEDIRFNILLNGDHLLDLKIRVQKNSIALLKETKLWK